MGYLHVNQKDSGHFPLGTKRIKKKKEFLEKLHSIQSSVKTIAVRLLFSLSQHLFCSPVTI